MQPRRPYCRLLRCENLEASPAVDRQLGGGRSGRRWPRCLMSAGIPTQETLLFASGEDSSLAFGVLAANADNPAVVQVDVPPAPVQSLAVMFSDDVNLADLIADGSAGHGGIAFQHVPRAGQTFRPSQFAYDPAAQKLTLTLTQSLAAGTYELRLDGSKIRNSAGHVPPRRPGRARLRDPHVRCSDLPAGIRRRLEGGWLCGALAGGLEQRRSDRLDRRRENGRGNRQGSRLSEFGAAIPPPFTDPLYLARGSEGDCERAGDWLFGCLPKGLRLESGRQAGFGLGPGRRDHPGDC